MATKDIGKGWGDLNGRLEAWHCPKCAIDSPVAAWDIVAPSPPFSMEGRKCPLCDFQAFQHGDTMRMIPPPPVVVKVVEKKKSPAKRAKKKTK